MIGAAKCRYPEGVDWNCAQTASGIMTESRVPPVPRRAGGEDPGHYADGAPPDEAIRKPGIDGASADCAEEEGSKDGP
jgi:hypothetical protein